MSVTPTQGKKATLADWPERRLTPADLAVHFARPGVNVGVLNGAPSHGLIDVDVDAPEAVACASRFLPTTPVVFGRQSKPRSHFEYLVAGEPPKSRKFEDVDGTTLVELRSTGTQTIWPPSTHPSGEAIMFDERGHLNGPTTWPTDGPRLRRQVGLVAACALMARHWAQRGGRDDLAMHYAGFLAHQGFDQQLAAQLIEAAARVARDEETAMRVEKVERAYARFANGEDITGAPHLIAALGEHGRRVVEKLQHWLGLRDAASARNGTWTIERIRATGKTAKEWASEAPPQIDWAIPRWLPFGALTSVEGQPKRRGGKSTFISWQVRALLEGGTFLGETAKKTRVIWLSEQPPMIFRPLLRRAGLDEHPDLKVFYLQDLPDVPWPLLVQAMVTEAKAFGAGVLIVDTLPAWVGIEGEGENQSGVALKACRQLGPAIAQKLAVLVVRHERKRGGEVGKAGRGSGAWEGAINHIITIRRVKGDPDSRVRQLATSSHLAEDVPEELTIRLRDPEAGEGEGYEVQDVFPVCGVPPAHDAVLAVLRAGEATLGPIIAQTGLPRATVCRTLVELEEQGRVTHPRRRGPYRLVSDRHPGGASETIRRDDERLTKQVERVDAPEGASIVVSDHTPGNDLRRDDRGARSARKPRRSRRAAARRTATGS